MDKQARQGQHNPGPLFWRQSMSLGDGGGACGEGEKFPKFGLEKQRRVTIS